MRLNRVVFPAPFGPMSPVIWPCSMLQCTWCSASSPPKRFVTSRTSRSFIGYPSLIIACSNISTSRLSLHLLLHISPPLSDLHSCLQDFFQKRGGFHMHQLSRSTSHGLDRLPEPCGSSAKLFQVLSCVPGPQNRTTR